MSFGLFPNLHDCETTSPPSTKYNCIAWAAGDTERWWWPVTWPVGYCYWPAGAQRQPTINAFITAFSSLGYETCESTDLEVGFEKVAIYAKPWGEPTHAAKQLCDGRWSSKLGRGEDIAHSSLHDLVAPLYGEVAVVLRRPRE